MTYHLLLAFDNDYAAHAATTLTSFLANNTVNNSWRITVLSSTLKNTHELQMLDISARYGSKIEFRTISETLLVGVPLGEHFSVSNYYRLFAADIIEDDFCLYLDVDIVVTDDISELWKLPLSDYYVAAVEDFGFDRHRELSMDPNSAYFNSGVMLINLKLWRQSGVRERVIDFVKENKDSIKFVDQCGLNAIIDGRWCKLDRIYNYQSYMCTGVQENISHADLHPKIIHYTGSSKPWQMGCIHPLKSKYWEYRKKTKYKTLFYDDFTIIRAISYITPRSLKDLFKKVYLSLDTNKK